MARSQNRNLWAARRIESVIQAGQIAASGVWFSLPAVGYWLMNRYLARSMQSMTGMARFSVAVALGLAAWSPVLMALVIAGIYSAPMAGGVGWILTGTIFLTRRRGSVQNRPGDTSGLDFLDFFLLVALIPIAFLYLSYPTESIWGGGDAGGYANHAVYIANHGRLDLPYPYDRTLDSAFQSVNPLSPKFYFPGFYLTSPHITVQFGHLFPVWLAQAFGTAGPGGLFRLNAIVALLFIPIFVEYLRMIVPKHVAVLTGILLSLNVSQIWIERITLSEVLTQFLIWAGLLLYLRGRQAAEVHALRVSGLLLGLSSFVRIDSFLIVPLILAAHFVEVVVADARDLQEARPLWREFHRWAVPTFILGALHYVILSWPYFSETLPQVAPIAALGIGLGIIVWYEPERLLGFSRHMVSKRTFEWAVYVLLVGVAAYAYFIRPHITPYAMVGQEDNNFYFNARDYREESLYNLGAYLTPVGLVLALAGLGVIARRAIFNRRNVHLIVPLSIVAGFSLLYIYKPGITPYQYYAIRRFVPVVIPGMFWAVATAVSGLLEGNRRRWKEVSVACIFGFLVWSSLHNASPILTVALDKGYYGQISRLAEKLPADKIILADGIDYTWMTPLLASFDRRVVPVNTETIAYQKPFIDWLRRDSGARDTALVLYEGALRVPGNRNRWLFTYPLNRLIEKGVFVGLPDTVLQQPTILRAYVLADPIEPKQYLGMALGGETVFGVYEDGFTQSFGYEEAPSRWTEDYARLTVQLDSLHTPRFMKLDIGNAAPRGTNLSVVVNRTKVLQQRLYTAGCDTLIRLPDLASSRLAIIEFFSSTFKPSEEIPGSTDDRSLGVCVRSVRLLEREEGSMSNPLSDEGFHSQLRPSVPEGRITAGRERPASLDLTIRNTGVDPWFRTQAVGKEDGSVRLGVRWYAAKDSVSWIAETHYDLPANLYPNDECRIHVILDPAAVVPPLGPGIYTVRISLVQEEVAWFDDKGDSTLSYRVDVSD